MNDGLKIWASPTTCEAIFSKAYEQNIILFDGQSLKVWAAPLEWALERKLRRIAYSKRGDKNVDMEDTLALFKHFRKANGGPLDMEYFRKLNMNGFDLMPEPHHMEKVATNYRDMYNEDLFSLPIAPTVPAEGSGINAWSEWSWSEQYKCNYRYRENPAEPGGYEYEYDTTTAMSAPLSRPQHRGSENGKGKTKR